MNLFFLKKKQFNTFKSCLHSKKLIKISSYLCNDEEKAVTTLGSKSSIKKNSYDGYQFIASSPDGTQVVTLNIAIHQLKSCKLDDLTKFTYNKL